MSNCPGHSIGCQKASGPLVSRARDTTKCVTRCKNGVNCEVCVFRCYSTQSRAASNRRTVYSKSSLPQLALLLSARSPVSPAAFLIHQKWREMRNTRFSLLWHSIARRKQQEKHSPASRVCQSYPSCFQPDRQSVLSLLSITPPSLIMAQCVALFYQPEGEEDYLGSSPELSAFTMSSPGSPLPLPVTFFLSCVSKTQPNHWTVPNRRTRALPVNQIPNLVGRTDHMLWAGMIFLVRDFMEPTANLAITWNLPQRVRRTILKICRGTPCYQDGASIFENFAKWS